MTRIVHPNDTPDLAIPWTNSTRETVHERWRVPRTLPNLAGMQDDFRKNVSDGTTNLCELKMMGYIVSSTHIPALMGKGYRTELVMQGVDKTPYI